MARRFNHSILGDCGTSVAGVAAAAANNGRTARPGMATDGGPRAWAFLRHNPLYRAQWHEAFVEPDFEAAPFPVRIQSQADRQALVWGLLAWEDPCARGGPASPFWAEAPRLDAEWGTDTPTLQGFLAKSGARLEGLRLGDGTLILKIENGTAAAQVRVRAGGEAAVGAGLVLRIGFGPGQADGIARLHDLGRLAGEAGRHARRGRSRTDRELLIVLDARLAGKSWRETAMDIYGAGPVTAEWHSDSWMRAHVRRRGDKARTLMESEYRRLAAGR